MKRKKGYSHDAFQRKGKKFINPHIDNARRSLVDIALWQLGFYNDRKSPKRIPDDFCYPNPKRRPKKTLPQVTWINHCTFLVEIDGLRILTDPIWSERCSPLDFLGPRRRHAPPLKIKKLPSIDIVLISHNHYDHLDRKTILDLNERFPEITWVVPLGVKKWFDKQGFSQVIELAWWESSQLSLIKHPKLEMSITAVPSQHFSGRGLFDKNSTLWAGFVVEFKRKKKKAKRFYFVGDTGYNRRDFKAIGKRFGEMDLSLIPIGTYVPHKFMDPVHINPNKAAKIHEEVHSRLSVGMHWKTFRLSGEELDRPPYDLYSVLEKKKVDPKTFRVIDPGQTINW